MRRIAFFAQAWLAGMAMVHGTLVDHPAPDSTPTPNEPAGSPPSSATSAWPTDLNAALKQAETEKKMVVVDITPDWNISGKRLDAESFSDPQVQSLLNTTVKVRLNPENSDDTKTQVDRLQVTTYPSILILNYKGTVVARMTGFQEAAKLQAFLAQYAGDFQDNPLGPIAPDLTPDDPLIQAEQHKPDPFSLPPRTVSYLLLDRCEETVAKDGSTRAVSRRSLYAVNPDLAREGELNGLSTVYDASRQKARFVYARIIDAAGKPHDLDVSQALDRTTYSYGDVTWDEHTLTLATPKLKQGEILDYEEEREAKPFLPGHFEFIWNTDSDRYTVVAKDLILRFPQDLGVTKTAVRCALPVTETKAADGTVTWELKSTATANPDNLFMTSLAESWQGYLFCTSWTWDALAAWFRSLDAGQDKLTPEAVAMVAQDKQQYPDHHDLVIALARWVYDNIRTLNTDYERSSRQPHPVDETLHYRCGDVKDQALLLRTLLREAGIPSSLALLRKGYASQIAGGQPMILQFDHCLVVAQVDGKDVYIDPLAEVSDSGWLPAWDSKAEALKISDKNNEKITLPAYQPRDIAPGERVGAELHPDGSATITSMFDFEGQLATQYKSIFSRITLDQARQTFAQTFKLRNEILTDFSMNDPRQPGTSFSITCVATAPQFSTMTGNGLTFRLGERGPSENWSARLDKPRTDPFRFYPSDPSVRSYTVTLPPGARLVSKPADLHLDTAFLTATQTSAIEDGKLVMTDSYAMKDAVIPAAQAEQVLNGFQRLEEHREGVFVISVGPPPAPEAAAIPPAPAPVPEPTPVSAPTPAPPTAAVSTPPPAPAPAPAASKTATPDVD